MWIIKKLLEDNKRAWHTKLKYALWVDKINTKRENGMSPFQLVYRDEVFFPTSSGVPVMKLVQEKQDEPNHMQRRINQIIELNELRDKSYDKVKIKQEKMKNTFDRKVKEEQFEIDYFLLKWDAPREDKHGNFEHMWVGPYIIATYIGENSFILHHQDGSRLKGCPVYGRYLKHYLSLGK